MTRKLRLSAVIDVRKTLWTHNKKKPEDGKDCQAVVQVSGCFEKSTDLKICGDWGEAWWHHRLVLCLQSWHNIWALVLVPTTPFLI